MNAAIVVLAKTNRYIRIFRTAGATNAARAIDPADHGIRNSFIFQSLVRKGVLQQVGNNLYYLDEKAEKAYKSKRLTTVLVVTGLAILAIILASIFCKAIN